MILHGPVNTNITLDESHFEHLKMIVVLEIHGFPHGQGVLRLRKNALKHLGNLRYINFQHLHLLGDPSTGNQPVAKSSSVQFGESNTMPRVVYSTSQESEEESNSIPGEIQFLQYKSEEEIVPYSVYQKQVEQAGLSTFTGLQNLVFLRAFHCHIKEVNWEMFMGLDKLKYLSLESNEIPFINDFSFYGTPNLKHLTISHNKILSVYSTALAGLLELEILDLSYNNISHLSEQSLPPLPKLISLDFHHNPLEVVLPHTFQVMNNTQNLFLGGKLATLEISHNSFLGLRKLKKLSLTGLYLEILEGEYFVGMHGLRQLRIEGTIHELSFDAFAEIPKLQELIIKHCSIKKISMDAFYGLYSLLYLDLSNNELEMLPPSLFDQQKSLKEINLSNNKLTTLPESLFTHVPAKLIRLDKNPWHCTCAMNEWQPSQVNKIKEKTFDNSHCQTRYDKGSMCKMRYMYQYRYDQSVSPYCATPSRFSGWSVFYLLRKHLRCQDKIKSSKKIQQKKGKTTNIKNYITGNIQNVTDGNSQFYLRNTAGISTSTQRSKLQTDEGKMVEQSTMGVQITSDEASTIQQHNEQNTESSFYSKTSSQTTQTSETADVKNISVTRIDDNQHLWTKQNKDKYKHFEEKYERTMKKFITKTIPTDKAMPEHIKKNTDITSKTKKQRDITTKWEVKMENTMRRLNSLKQRNNDTSTANGK